MTRFFIIALWCILAFGNASAKEVMHYHRYTTADGLLQNNATTFCQDKDGYVWVGSRSGLCRFNGVGFEHYNLTADGRKIGWVRKLRTDKDGKSLVMKVNNGEYVRFCPQTRVLTVIDKNLKMGEQDVPKGMLTYTTEGLLLRHNGNEYRIPHTGNYGMQTFHCENFVDRQGNVWLNYDNALYQVTFANVEYNIYNNVRDAQSTPFTADVRCIYRLNDGTWLVATKAQQLIRYTKDGVFAGFIDENGRLQQHDVKFLESVYNIQQDAEGRIWLALRVAGVVCIDKAFTAEQRLYHYKTENTPQILNNSIFDLHYSERTGWLWIGSWGNGTYVVDTRQKGFTLEALGKSMKYAEPSELQHVRHICEVGDTVAVCTTAGLYLYDQHGKLLAQVGDYDVTGVIRTNGKVYVSTYSQGVYTLNDGKMQEIEVPGLGDCVLTMSQYDGGSLLFTTPECIVMYDLQRGSCRYFNNQFFGEFVNFSEAQPVFDGNTLYMGLANGILALPLRWQEAAETPHIVVGNAGMTVSIGGNVVMKPDVLDLRVPRNVSIAWREKGDKRWNYCTDKDIAITLAWYMPGRHVVELRSTDAMGVWSDEVTEVEYYVAPSWWQWCIIAVVLLLLGIIGVLIYRVTHPRLITTSDTAVETATDIFPSMPDVTPYDRELVQKLVANIEREMDNPDYDVAQLAQAMGMNRSQLYHQCKESLDKTPAAFILEIRMKRAMQLIETRQLRINEIAYKVGFTDPNYFAKVFKKRVGMSPSQYAEGK